MQQKIEVALVVQTSIGAPDLVWEQTIDREPRGFGVVLNDCRPYRESYRIS